MSADLRVVDDGSDRLITEAALAERLALAVITVRQMRARGQAPPHIVIGRSIRYSLRSVNDWIAARTFGAAK